MSVRLFFRYTRPFSSVVVVLERVVMVREAA